MGDDHDAFGKGMRAMEARRKADKKYRISDLKDKSFRRGILLIECLKRLPCESQEDSDLIKNINKELNVKE